MDSLRKRLANLYWWALPSWFTGRETSRVFQTELPDWIKTYKVEPGYYVIRAKFMGPAGYYRSLSVLGLVLSAVALIDYTLRLGVAFRIIAIFHDSPWVPFLTQSWGLAWSIPYSWLDLLIVHFAVLLAAPIWPLLLDAPSSKLELIIDQDGYIIERSLKGVPFVLANFNEAYDWVPMPHSQMVEAGNRRRLAGGLWQGFQGIVGVVAAIGQRPTATLLTTRINPPDGAGPYQQASELFIVRGAGGAMMVKIAEFMDDANLFKARALRAAVEHVVVQVRKDLSDMGMVKALPPVLAAAVPAPSAPDREQYE